MNNQQHEMILTKIYPSGAEEWFCPECGRRFIMQWPPVYKKVILNIGDENAIHSGGRGGENDNFNDGEQESASNGLGNHQEDNRFIYSSTESSEFPHEQAGRNPAGYDSRSLEPWLEWMERVNFERLWKE